MIATDVRIKEKETTIGHQHEESFLKYYDVEIEVFDKWWSSVGKPEDKTDLDTAIALRDTILDTIRGRN